MPQHMYTLGINAAFHDPGRLPGPGRRGRRGGRGGALHAHQARQAAGAVLDLGAAVPRDRLLPARGRHRRWPTWTTSPTRSTRTSCLGAAAHDATIALPLEPSAHPAPAEWESAWDPLFLSSIVNAPRQLAGGAPHHLQARFRGVRADGPFRWHFVEHHLAHAASAFLPSPFERAAILTLDGRGETRDDRPTASGEGTDIEIARRR